MKLLFKVVVPVLVLIGSVFAAKTILENRPEPRKRPQFPKVQAVEATTLAKSNYPVVIRSQGTVKPTQSSTLVAEVTGTVVELSENFVVGGRFSKGDVLVQIDERDYTIAVTQAQANLAQATAALQEETARGQLARTEWDSLRRGETASEFTLRLPQLAAARANLDAAKAQVDRAKLDLARTQFVAPFDGSVADTSVDQGQFVSRGSRLGQIYSNDSVDVRLPLSSRQLTFLDIPSSGSVPQSQLPNIELTAIVAGEKQTWTGKVVRAEGVDVDTQQLNVIARVAEPFSQGAVPLRIGQYVQANIAGRVLEDVFVLPRAAIREDREVLLVTKESQLVRRDVIVAWADEQTAAISDGLEEGSVLVITPLSTVTNGTPVRATIDGKAPPPVEGRPEGGAGGKGKGKWKGGKGDAARGEGKPGKARQGEAQRGEGRSDAGKPDGEIKRGKGSSREGQVGNGQGKPVKDSAEPATTKTNLGTDKNTETDTSAAAVNELKTTVEKIDRSDDAVSN